MENQVYRRDPNMLKYPLMGSVIPTVMLSLLYLIFVLYIGPNWMKNRKPFVLKTPMLVYNVALVILSSWMVYTSVVYRLSRYNWRCEPHDTSDEYTGVLIQASWMYYISKFVEFFDTIFFVLRKKDNQINFLHLFHHSTIPIQTWFAIAYVPGGYNAIPPTANAFVHIWMYLYYALSALGPRVQKYLWWKKYITKLQLLQFVIIMLHCSQLLMFPKEGCDVNTYIVKMNLALGVIYIGLFSNFYLKSYVKTEKHNTTGRNGCNNNGHTPTAYYKVKKELITPGSDLDAHLGDLLSRSKSY